MRLLDLQEATYHQEHPIFDFIKEVREKHRGYETKKINKEEFEPLYNALTRKFGEPITFASEEEPHWQWGDHAFAGTDVEVNVYHDKIDDQLWIEVQTWTPMHEATYHQHQEKYVELYISSGGRGGPWDADFGFQQFSKFPDALYYNLIQNNADLVSHDEVYESAKEMLSYANEAAEAGAGNKTPIKDYNKFINAIKGLDGLAFYLGVDDWSHLIVTNIDSREYILQLVQKRLEEEGEDDYFFGDKFARKTLGL
jgi:hypothetical protein